MELLTTNLHVHLGDWILLEIFVVAIVQDVVVVKGHALRSKHVREESEFFFLKALV